MRELAQSLVDALRNRNETICFCESLTAGLAAATVADIPGASMVLRGGLVTYATDLKASLANVPPAILEEQGPVSPVTAREMARGARRACGADWAVSVTGVAGPDAQDGHPVGEVWVGLSGPRWTASSSAADLVDAEWSRFALVPGAPVPVRLLAGDRAQIRRTSVQAALAAALAGLREQKLPANR
ncbi:Putative competence-damage inducible protein [Corynebacterium capitovis DSM 44611]|uniref:CinA family protein n=1 Tax=Corynebacterium capitovis TaxID=131081 RepID=UPI00035C622F|nr:CinA family protein [Corynebacterium capitovis]WKD57495.1 Putative competence-damage inducible protein [Corynebacterium capitovis DSM 44611]